MGTGRALPCITLIAATIATASRAQVPAAAVSASSSAASSPAASISAPIAPRASATAPAASPSWAPAAPVASVALPMPSSSTRPFGPGQAVSIDCDKPFAYGYVARGALDTRPSYPDPFIKVGRLPITLELPPGTYTIIVEGDEVSPGSTVFEVRQGPVRVKVSAGKSGLRSFSTWMLGFGIAAVLAAGVLELSGGGDQDARQKNAIAIPLFIAGGVAAVSGLTMFLVSRTTFRTDGFVPGRTAAGPGSPMLTISGHF